MVGCGRCGQCVAWCWVARVVRHVWSERGGEVPARARPRALAVCAVPVCAAPAVVCALSSGTRVYMWCAWNLAGIARPAGAAEDVYTSLLTRHVPYRGVSGRRYCSITRGTCATLCDTRSDSSIGTTRSEVSDARHNSLCARLPHSRTQTQTHRQRKYSWHGLLGLLQVLFERRQVSLGKALRR